MSDLYLEEMIRKKRTAKDQLLKALLVGVTVILVALAVLTFNLIFMIPAFVVCIADIFLMPRFNVEWEYQYVNGELDIDRITNKAKRKRIASYDLTNAELLAPAVSHRLDYYSSNTKLKVKDYTSCEPERAKFVYALVIAKEGEMTKVLFEPSEKMLKDMRTKAPRKVFFD